MTRFYASTKLTEALLCQHPEGHLAYTYLWNTTPAQTTATATNLPAGTYTVTVTDAIGNSATQSATVYQPSLLSVSAISNPTPCQDTCEGTATVTASGGTPPYYYYWSNGQTGPVATGLCAGIYTITVTDATGCSVIGSVIVTQPPEPAPLILTVIDVLCYGDTSGMVELNYADIQPTNTYLWSNGETTQDIDNLPAGWYQVTVTTVDSCVRIANITVNQPADPLTSFISNVDASCSTCNDGTATAIVSGGTAPYTYSWNTSPAQNSSTAINLLPGTYTVTITDGNGCSLTDSVVVSFNNNINEVINSSLIIVYPNPANDNITIENPSQATGKIISVYNIQGQLLMYQPLQDTKNVINVSHLSQGLYFLKIENNFGIEVRKFIKE